MLTRILDSKGPHNKVLQIRWLRQQKPIVSQKFWRLGVQNQSVRRGGFFWGLWRKDLFHVPFSASGGLLVFLGIPQLVGMSHPPLPSSSSWCFSCMHVCLCVQISWQSCLTWSSVKTSFPNKVTSTEGYDFNTFWEDRTQPIIVRTWRNWNAYTTCGKVKWLNYFGKQFDSFLKKVKSIITLLSTYSTCRYLLKKNERICPHKDSYLNVHCNFIYNSIILETTKITINR